MKKTGEKMKEKKLEKVASNPTEKTSWFKALLNKYNELCKDLGVDAGACRGCVPIVKFDPEKSEKEKEIPKKNE